ncbi:hypothetical protein Tco_1308533, partial [Tanacetum coccineum]
LPCWCGTYDERLLNDQPDSHFINLIDLLELFLLSFDGGIAIQECFVEDQAKAIIEAKTEDN